MSRPQTPSSSTPFVHATDTLILIEGRHLRTSEGIVRLGFPGTSLRLRLKGTALAMRVVADNDEVYFDLRINGGEASRLRAAKGQADYPVLAEDTAGPHEIEITRRNESWQGTCDVLGFIPGENSHLIDPPSLPAPRLLFIGDSITCGEKTEYRTDDPLLASSPSRACSANSRVSYGMLIAQALGARCHLVSYGGRGVIRDWQGIKTCANAPQFYELALPDLAGVFWDHGSYIPDVVGICLGTNDFNQGIPDQNEFVNAYVELVRKIQRDAPKARILLIDSPIVRDDPVTGPRRSVLHHFLEEVVRKVASPKVLLAPLNTYPGIPGDGHPSGTEHRSIAAELLPAFRQALA